MNSFLEITYSFLELVFERDFIHERQVLDFSTVRSAHFCCARTDE